MVRMLGGGAGERKGELLQVKTPSRQGRPL